MSSLEDAVMFGALVSLRTVDDGDVDNPYLKTVIFNFEKGHVSAAFDEEFATLNIESAPSHNLSGAESEIPMCRELVGTEASWAWVLTNQNGHEDGFQIEFINSEANTTAAIQVVTGAASLVVSSLHPVQL